jgi:hypothetical protein
VRSTDPGHGWDGGEKEQQMSRTVDVPVTRGSSKSHEGIREWLTGSNSPLIAFVRRGQILRRDHRLGRRATGLLGALLLAIFGLIAVSSPAGAVKPKPPVVPQPCNVTGADTIVFTGADSTGTGPAAWNDPLNWSPNQIPGASDFACIPSTYGKQVSLNLNDSVPNYAIQGVNDESAAGLALTNMGITLTGTAQSSVLNNFVLNGVSGSTLGVATGGVLDLTGSATIDSASSTVSGPGTINTVHGASVSTGPYTGFEAGLQWNNYGTLTGDGVGLCVSSTNPIAVTNEPKGTMVFSSGGGLNDSGGCSGSDQGIVVNDAKGSITVSNASFSINAPFDNEGKVTDEKNPLTGSSGLTIGDGNTGLNGVDAGSYTTKSAKTTLGEINFNGPRDLTSATVGGSGTYGFNAINAGINLADPTLASVVQTGTTSGGMVITKGITFEYSELGENIQSDTGSPTSTVIDSGASVNFAGWNANFENGHSLVINSGGTLNLAGESLCLGPASTLTNSGRIVMTGSNSGASDGYCGGPGASVTNTASGTLTSSSTNGQITLPFVNSGSVGVTAGSLTVYGNGGQTETGSWQTASGTTLAFASGLSTVTGDFSGSGTVSVGCYTTLGFSGQSLKNLFIAGETTGDYTVTGALSMTTENECVDYPTIVIPSGTVSIAGDFSPQQYEQATVDLTVNGASGTQLSVGQLDVSGTADLNSSSGGAALSVATAAGVAPAVGQSAQIVTAGTTVGDFSFSTTCAGSGVAYQLAPDSTGISLDVVSDGSCT